MVGNGDSWCCLVRHFGEVCALNSCLRVVQSIEVTGGQSGNGLSADHHSCILDHLEHLRNAVVDVADQPTDSWLIFAECHFARGGNLQAHFLFNIGCVHAIAFAELPGCQVNMELGNNE